MFNVMVSEKIEDYDEERLGFEVVLKIRLFISHKLLTIVNITPRIFT